MECLKNVPDSIDFPFYVYGTSKIVDLDEKQSIILSGYDIAPDMRIVWVPKIIKPVPTSNSYLFLCRKNSDVHQIIWILPRKALWEQYKPGMVAFNDNIYISIMNYTHRYKEMCQPDPNGPTEKDKEKFFRIFGEEAQKRKNEKKRTNKKVAI
jgi:hypothetical protein